LQKDVKDLPEPVTINCMQTDSRNFYFGCLQLHSLDLDSSKVANNLFWIEDPQPMFTKCDYVDNKPVLEGYNPQVLETLMALYKSQMATV
jgi:large subunit ribosomal protein L37